MKVAKGFCKMLNRAMVKKTVIQINTTSMTFDFVVKARQSVAVKHGMDTY